jgi:hypothetical protein
MCPCSFPVPGGLPSPGFACAKYTLNHTKNGTEVAAAKRRSEMRKRKRSALCGVGVISPNPGLNAKKNCTFQIKTAGWRHFALFKKTAKMRGFALF